MNGSPLLALAGLAAIGLLATRLPWLRWPPGPRLELLRAGVGPLLLLGVALGPGIDLLARPALRPLAPVTALALGWAGAVLGARFEWRRLRRIPRPAWTGPLASAAATLALVALGGALLARLSRALGAAWAPRVPVLLALAAVAAASGPGAVALVTRSAGVRPRLARAFALAAALETACAALALTVPLALLRRPHAGGAGAGLAWLAWIGLALGAGGLAGIGFLALTRGRSGRAGTGVALLAALLFGAGVAYAADVSPFIVGALAAALIVNRAPARHRVREILAAWAPSTYAIVFVIAGALLTWPTAWGLVAAACFAALRIAAHWVGARSARPAWRHPGLATVAQGGTAVALGLSFALGSAGPGPEPGGAVLTTVVLGVVLAELAAPPLLARGLRPAPAPLTPAAALPELSPNPPADWRP